MGNGYWMTKPGGRTGSSPTHFDAYSKMQLGYVSLEAGNLIEKSADETGTVELFSIANSMHGYNVLKISNEAYPEQYYLLENRGLWGYDEGLWAFDLTPEKGNNGGILIYHVDERGSNSTPPHYQVGVMLADGVLFYDN
jgi:hypothetical protein